MLAGMAMAQASLMPASRNRLTKCGGNAAVVPIISTTKTLSHQNAGCFKCTDQARSSWRAALPPWVPDEGNCRCAGEAEGEVEVVVEGDAW